AALLDVVDLSPVDLREATLERIQLSWEPARPVVWGNGWGHRMASCCDETRTPRAPGRSAFTPAPAQQAEVRDDERHDEVQSTLDEGGRTRITRDEHIELVDRRQNDANNQSDSQRAAQVGTLAA